MPSRRSRDRPLSIIVGGEAGLGGRALARDTAPAPARARSRPGRASRDEVGVLHALVSSRFAQVASSVGSAGVGGAQDVCGDRIEVVRLGDRRRSAARRVFAALRRRRFSTGCSAIGSMPTSRIVPDPVQRLDRAVQRIDAERADDWLAARPVIDRRGAERATEKLAEEIQLLVGRPRRDDASDRRRHRSPARSRGSRWRSGRAPRPRWPGRVRRRAGSAGESSRLSLLT